MPAFTASAEGGTGFGVFFAVAGIAIDRSRAAIADSSLPGSGWALMPADMNVPPTTSVPIPITARIQPTIRTIARINPPGWLSDSLHHGGNDAVAARTLEPERVGRRQPRPLEQVAPERRASAREPRLDDIFADAEA